jgi:hypothetical protein
MKIAAAVPRRLEKLESDKRPRKTSSPPEQSATPTAEVGKWALLQVTPTHWQQFPLTTSDKSKSRELASVMEVELFSLHLEQLPRSTTPWTSIT